MRASMPRGEDVLALPPLLTIVIPSGWQDANEHVNIQHYLALYDRAGWPMLEQLGIDSSHFRDRRQGLFDLEHHLWYLAEMHVGDRISAHARFLGRSEKRLHGLMFLFNLTRNRLASVLEFVSTGADLDTRRTAALPDVAKARLDELIATHAALDWQPPGCGVMSA